MIRDLLDRFLLNRCSSPSSTVFDLTNYTGCLTSCRDQFLYEVNQRIDYNQEADIIYFVNKELPFEKSIFNTSKVCKKLLGIYRKEDINYSTGTLSGYSWRENGELKTLHADRTYLDSYWRYQDKIRDCITRGAIEPQYGYNLIRAACINYDLYVTTTFNYIRFTINPNQYLNPLFFWTLTYILRKMHNPKSLFIYKGKTRKIRNIVEDILLQCPEIYLKGNVANTGSNLLGARGIGDHLYHIYLNTFSADYLRPYNKGVIDAELFYQLYNRKLNETRT
jgi:hypothetical protein